MSPPTDAEIGRIAADLSPFNPRILLTGAGFSKPWGGLLTSEIWSVIVADRSTRTRPKVDSLLHRYLNFEEALAIAEVGRSRRLYSAADRGVLREVVTRAFSFQDERARRTDPGLTTMLMSFVDNLATNARGTTCIFTLNQDLVLERYAATGQRPWIQIPGVSREDWWFGGLGPTACYQGRAKARVPVNDFTAASFTAAKNGLSYIKLHGSANWYDQSGDVAVWGGVRIPLDPGGRSGVIRALVPVDPGTSERSDG